MRGVVAFAKKANRFIVFASVALATVIGSAHASFPGMEVRRVFDVEDFANPNPPNPERPEASVSTLRALPDGRVVIGLGDVRAYLWDPAVDVRPSGTGILPPPFLNLRNVPRNESGVIGCVAAPDFAATGHFYLCYTSETGPLSEDLVPTARTIRVERFTVDPANRHGILPNDRAVVFEFAVDSVLSLIHFGGGLEFGPDGMLYMGVGDSAKPANSQSLDSWRGKVLRMRPDGTAPEDNPFYNPAAPGSSASYIYAKGLRNPYRLHYSAPHGMFLVADVGSNIWEEINVLERGANYGWPQIDGPSSDNPGVAHPADYRDPWYSYLHGKGEFEGAAVVGLLTYTGDMFPEMFRDRLFYSDFGFFQDGGKPGHVYTLQVGEDKSPGTVETFYQYPHLVVGASDMTMLGDGSILVAATLHFSGGIDRFSYRVPDEPPSIAINVSPLEGEAPLAVDFSAVVTDADATTVEWRSGGLYMQSNAPFTHVVTEPGLYDLTATATDTFGQQASDSRQLRVFERVTTATLTGRVLDASRLPLAPVEATVLVTQRGGPALGEGLAGQGGEFSVMVPPFESVSGLIDVTVESPGLVTRRYPLATGESHELEIHLSEAALVGEVIDAVDGSPIPGAGLSIFLRDSRGVPQPYPGAEESADVDGRFYLPIRTGDTPGVFQIEATLGGTEEEYQTLENEFPAEGPGEVPAIVEVQRIAEPEDCDNLAAPGWFVVSYAEVQTIFNTHCIGCHGPVSPYRGLVLAEGLSFSMVVNRRSDEMPSKFLAEQHEASILPPIDQYLLDKVNCSAPGYGSVMPPYGKISGRERRDIAQWMRIGARHDKSAATIWLAQEEVASGSTVTIRGGGEGPLPPFDFRWEFDDGTTGEGPLLERAFLADQTRETSMTLRLFNTAGAPVAVASARLLVLGSDPSPTPSPSPTASPTETPTPTDTPTPTGTSMPTDSPAPTMTPDPTDLPGPTETPNATASATATTTPEPYAARDALLGRRPSVAVDQDRNGDGIIDCSDIAW